MCIERERVSLIGGNRLVLFDTNWNPANDKQVSRP